MRTEAFWRGEKGWLEVAAPIGTVAAAAFAAVMAFRTFSANRKEGMDTRFQKAVELLSDDTEIGRIGGVFAMRDIINTDPTRYYLTGIAVLAAFISEQCSRVSRAYAEAEATQPPEERRFDPGPTANDTMLALEVIGRVRTNERVLQYELSDGRYWHYTIDCFVLNEVTITNLNLSKIKFGQIIYGRGGFSKCDFSGCQMAILPSTPSGTDTALQIRDCDLTGVHMIGDRSPFIKSFVAGALAKLTERWPKISIVECDLQRATIEVESVSISISVSNVGAANIRLADTMITGCWYSQRAPSVSNPNENSMPPVEAPTRVVRTTERGMLVY